MAGQLARHPTRSYVKNGMWDDSRQGCCAAKNADRVISKPRNLGIGKNFWSFDTIDCAGARYGYLPPSLDPQRLNENSIRTSKNVGK